MQPNVFPYYGTTPSVNTVLLMTIGEKKKWENYASTNIKEDERCKTWKAIQIGKSNVKNGPASYRVIREWVKMICKFCTLLVCKRFFTYVFIWSWIPCHWTNFWKFQKVTIYWFTVTINIMPQPMVKKWRNFGIKLGGGLTVCVCVHAREYIHTKI